MPYTEIEDVGAVCDDCGAWAPTERQVTHFETCKPGESERWKKYYDEADEEPAS